MRKQTLWVSQLFYLGGRNGFCGESFCPSIASLIVHNAVLPSVLLAELW